jgi:hypothetical protein
MSTSDELMRELSTLIEETGERIAEDYHYAFLEFLAELNLPNTEYPLPLRLWTALAQGLADASGYRVSLQAFVLEPNDGKPMDYQIVGYREVAAAEPTIYVQLAEE